MTDYHKKTDSYLSDFRTILAHLNNFNRGFKWIKGTNPDYAKTIELMEDLRQDLLKYKKTGSITCRNCGLVEGSHGKWGFASNRGCEGWNPK